MPRLPPLKALRAFEAAARHLSFRKAAEEIGVTPTAISHQIRLLEETCGQPLFRRQPRPLSLTEAGHQLYPVASEGFHAVARAFDEISLHRQARPLRVTTPGAFAARWLVPRLPEWRRHAPTIALEIIGTDGVVDIAGDEADLAIRYAREAPPGPKVRHLFEDRFGPVCRADLLPDGPLEDAADLLALPQIGYEWLRADPRNPTWEAWWRAARRTDPASPSDHPTALGFSEEAHAIQAVLNGQGVGLLSDVVVSHDLTGGRLVRAHALTIPGMGYWVVTRRDHPRRKWIAAFTNWVAQTG